VSTAVFFLLVGSLISLLLTPLVIWLAKSGHGIDQPDDFRKKHDRGISRLGGIPLMAAYAFALGVVIATDSKRTEEWAAVLWCSMLIFLLGLWDDFRPLGAKIKLTGQILIALLAFSLGLTIDRFTHPSSGFTISLGTSSLFVTVFWLIAIPNIVNLIDGIDGLAGGLGVFLFLTLSVVGLFSGHKEVAWIGFAMAGALLGFLCFNLPPARIFLGDGGAYLIGFGIAAISLVSSNKGSIAAALLVVAVALGLPILDTTLAILRRAFNGFPLFRADDEHIHHRLIKLGFSRQRILLILYTACVALSIVGMSIFWSQGKTIPIVAGSLFLVAVLAVRFLGYIGRWTDLRTQAENSLSHRREVKYVVLIAQVAEIEAERCPDREAFWNFFEGLLSRAGFYLRPQPDAGQMHEIHLEFRDLDPWILYCACTEKEVSYRRQLANCFRAAYRRAMLKWPPLHKLSPASPR
jgi:UDP-GlcNAc:undecaprenyl-phosphate GlcNAc-1-phosphate transferase